jgi:hypothetical protein
MKLFGYELIENRQDKVATCLLKHFLLFLPLDDAKQALPIILYFFKKRNSR